MSWQPVVSIVTPSYNQANFLESTIRSVLRQDYPNMEFGIVDGGSEDASLEIIKKYEDQLSWWISEPDQGQSHAINKGIARTKGEVVAWLNSDDLYLPDAINNAVDFLERYNVDLVFGNAIIIDERGYPLNNLVFGDWGLEEFLRFRVICQPAVFMKRHVWDEVFGLNTDLHYMLDHQLWIKVSSKYSVKYIPSYWAASRYHKQAKNVALASGFAEDISQLLNWIKSDVVLAPNYLRDKNRIRGGAYRLRGRYLLDGDYPLKSFMNYCRAFWFWPTYTLIHWRRILFSFVSMITPLKSSMVRKLPQQEIKDEWGDLTSWPGINLNMEKT
jgi:glycosyltransferase involved in cell wall biosynthesis